MTISRKTTSTSTNCQNEPPCRLKSPRWSNQLHPARVGWQSRTVPHPIGRPAVAAADSCAWSFDRHSCVVLLGGQFVPLAATWLTAVLTAFWLYRVRPMVSTLMLSSTIRIAPRISVIMPTCRLYQPDTRLMWSSYQRCTEVRNRLTSSSAFLARACNDDLNGSGSLSTLRWIVAMTVSPAASGVVFPAASGAVSSAASWAVVSAVPGATRPLPGSATDSAD